MSTEETIRQLDLALTKVDEAGTALAVLKSQARSALNQVNEALTTLARSTAALAGVVAGADVVMDRQMEVVAVLAAAREAELADTTTPTQPPASPVVLEVLRNAPVASAASDRDKLIAMFGYTQAQLAENPGLTCDPSTSITSFMDGTFLIAFDAARRTSASGGSSWVNADIPLWRKVRAAEISYDVLFVGPWDWGASLKMPGLGRWVEGMPAGGGTVTPRNWSVRPCFEEYGRDGVGLRFGPYVYSQDRRPWSQYGGDAWGEDYATGALRWRKQPTGTALEVPAVNGKRVKVVTRVELDRTVTARVLDSATGAVLIESSWPQMQLLGAGEPMEVTHVRFNWMYGGDNASYGPKLPVTKLLVSNFRVTEIK